jgi:Ca-activated chloride channel family protein
MLSIWAQFQGSTFAEAVLTRRYQRKTHPHARYCAAVAASRYHGLAPAVAETAVFQRLTVWIVEIAGGSLMQTLIAIGAGVLVAALVAIAEMLHARRVARVGRLAFGPEERPRPWTRIVGPIRSIALGAFAWALVTIILLSTGYFSAPPEPIGAHTRHLVFIADLSPSMYLADAGPGGDEARRARMAEVVSGVLDRVGGDLTFSIIGIYTDALPVVLQVRDRAVVRNVFDGMPLTYAMGPGQTDLGTSISKSMELIAPFREKSTTVFICTDGDTTPLAVPIAAPRSVVKTTVLGVGDTEKGTFIDGHQSRQDAGMLRAIASSLNAEYININKRHVPTSALSDLVVRPPSGNAWSLIDISIAVMGVTGFILAFIPVAQQYAGTGWRVRSVGMPAGASRAVEAA